MSTAILRSPEPESPYAYLVKRTIEACRSRQRSGRNRR